MKKSLAALAAVALVAVAGCGGESSVLPDGPPTATGVLTDAGPVAASDGGYNFAFVLSAPDAPKYDGAIVVMTQELIGARDGEEWGGAPAGGARAEVWLKDCSGEPLWCTMIAVNELTN